MNVFCHGFFEKVFTYHVRLLLDDIDNMRMSRINTEVHSIYQSYPIFLQQFYTISQIPQTISSCFRITKIRPVRQEQIQERNFPYLRILHVRLTYIEPNFTLLLPSSLEQLSITENSTYRIIRKWDTRLPPSLRFLKVAMSKWKNDFTSYLPPSLTQLELYHQASITNIILKLKTFLDLRILKLSTLSGRIGPYSLPDSLEILDLGDYNEEVSIHTFLPPNIKSLLMRRYNYPITLPLPRTLTSLFIPNFCQPLASGILPSSLLELSIKNIESVDLPPNLNNLMVRSNFTSSSSELTTYLPSSLTELFLSSPFNQRFPISLGFTKITELTLPTYFNQPLPPLPSTLISLHFGTDYNRPEALEFLPPVNIKKIIFGFKFNQPFTRPFPSTLQFLKLDVLFTQPIPFGILPVTLKELHLRKTRIRKDDLRHLNMEIPSSTTIRYFY